MPTIRNLFRIDHPLVQAPMAGVQLAGLAAAVSEAGALGSIPCALLTVPGLVKELEAFRARTRRPVNVNFFCHGNPAPDAAAQARWREALAPYYREYGIDPATIDAGPGRAPFSAEAAAALEPFRPEVVSFHFGLPDAALLARVKGWGSKVMSTATTVEEAKWLEAHGVDAIIAQGLEAGGHRGMFLTEDVTTQVATLPLVAQVVKAVRVPVIAAGGIADARGVRAAMALGAAGVQVGTAFLCGGRAAYGAHQRLHRPPGARHRQSRDPRAGLDLRGGAGLPARHRRDRAAAREGGGGGRRGFLAAVVGAGCERLPGRARRRGRGAPARRLRRVISSRPGTAARAGPRPPPPTTPRCR